MGPRCTKLQTQFDKGIVTFEEFGFNVVITLIAVCDSCMRGYLATLPASVATPLNAYLNSLLEAEGQMPLIRPHCMRPYSEEEIRRKSQYLGPRIAALRQALGEGGA
jgi:hypothetical protein